MNIILGIGVRKAFYNYNQKSKIYNTFYYKRFSCNSQQILQDFGLYRKTLFTVTDVLHWIIETLKFAFIGQNIMKDFLSIQIL